MRGPVSLESCAPYSTTARVSIFLQPTKNSVHVVQRVVQMKRYAQAIHPIGYDDIFSRHLFYHRVRIFHLQDNQGADAFGGCLHFYLQVTSAVDQRAGQGP